MPMYFLNYFCVRNFLLWLAISLIWHHSTVPPGAFENMGGGDEKEGVFSYHQD